MSGLQMLAGEIHDDVQSRGEALGEQVTGYEIQHGVTEVTGGEPFPGGCAVGPVYGTSWHGIFESDGFRRGFLARVAAAAGRRFAPADVSFQSERSSQLDALAELIGQHMDTGALLRLVEGGAPAGLPFVPPGAPAGPPPPARPRPRPTPS